MFNRLKKQSTSPKIQQTNKTSIQTDSDYEMSSSARKDLERANKVQEENEQEEEQQNEEEEQQNDEPEEQQEEVAENQEEEEQKQDDEEQQQEEVDENEQEEDEQDNHDDPVKSMDLANNEDHEVPKKQESPKEEKTKQAPKPKQKIQRPQEDEDAKKYTKITVPYKDILVAKIKVDETDKKIRFFEYGAGEKKNTYYILDDIFSKQNKSWQDAWEKTLKKVSEEHNVDPDVYKKHRAECIETLADGNTVQHNFFVEDPRILYQLIAKQSWAGIKEVREYLQMKHALGKKDGEGSRGTKRKNPETAQKPKQKKAKEQSKSEDQQLEKYMKVSLSQDDKLIISEASKMIKESMEMITKCQSEISKINTVLMEHQGKIAIASSVLSKLGDGLVKRAKKNHQDD